MEQKESAKGKKKKESSKTKSESKKTGEEKVKKIMKKKRARIIEPIDSSDDEDHLPVSSEFF